MKIVQRKALRRVIYDHFDKGPDRNQLMNEMVEFIEKHYAEVSLTNNQVLNELITEIKDSGDLKRWKRRLAYDLKNDNLTP